MAKLSTQTIRNIKHSLLVILGSLILGVGCGIFLVPHNIVSGGLSGLAIIINHFFPVMDVELFVTILTWVFFFLGWIILGKKFALSTLISAIVYPLALMLGTFLSELPLFSLSTYYTFNNENFATVNYLIAAIFGGLLVGVGCGLTFLGGGSTGGVDVIILAVQKFTGIKASTVTFFIDSSIIVVGFLFVNSLDVTLMGIISAFFASAMIKKLFDNEKNVSVNIISKKYLEINKIVLEKLDRGSTIINAVGGYSEEEVKMLQVVLDIREYYVLQDIIAKVDPNAFMYMHHVGTVRGEGFKAHITSNSKKERKKKNETTEL